MHGPEEWRSRRGARKGIAPHRIRPIGLLHTFLGWQHQRAAAPASAGRCRRPPAAAVISQHRPVGCVHRAPQEVARIARVAGNEQLRGHFAEAGVAQLDVDVRRAPRVGHRLDAAKAQAAVAVAAAGAEALEGRRRTARQPGARRGGGTRRARRIARSRPRRRRWRGRWCRPAAAPGPGARRAPPGVRPSRCTRLRSASQSVHCSRQARGG